MANFYKKSQISRGRAQQEKAQSGRGKAQQEKAQSGRSMVEMLGVLAIIGVLSIGGIAGYSKAMEKYKTNKAIDQTAMVINNVRTLFAGAKNYTALNTKAYSLGVFPEDMAKKSENSAYNALNGYIEVGTGVSETASNMQWDLTVQFNGREACTTLLTQNWGSSDQIAYIQSFTAGDRKVYRFEGKNLPISMTAALDVCKWIGGSGIGSSGGGGSSSGGGTTTTPLGGGILIHFWY